MPSLALRSTRGCRYPTVTNATSSVANTIQQYILSSIALAINVRVARSGNIHICNGSAQVVLRCEVVTYSELSAQVLTCSQSPNPSFCRCFRLRHLLEPVRPLINLLPVSGTGSVLRQRTGVLFFSPPTVPIFSPIGLGGIRILVHGAQQLRHDGSERTRQDRRSSAPLPRIDEWWRGP